MKKAVVKFLLFFVVFTAIFVVQKPVFMSVYSSTLGISSLWDWVAVPWHGLPMDFAVAGYLSVVPGILIIAMVWTRRRWPGIAMNIYLGIVAAIISAIFCLDMVLYSYWGFRLDMTPFFYVATSPSAAMASAEWWQVLCGSLGFLIAGALIWWALWALNRSIDVQPSRSPKTTAVLCVMLAALIIPIRGSVTVSTMNPSRSYFSQIRGLNHAATNPAFNLLYSATHQNDFATRYRFMDQAEADTVFASMGQLPDTTATPPAPLLRQPRPDIVFVVLESFSNHLMPALGGAPVAMGLDSLAREGVLFTNLYANSFRTDRALPSIFSALPGQPSSSVLKYIGKIEAMPSIPLELKKAGYTTSYFYGGDTNFTNMQAYLMAMGFDSVMSDKDFSVKEKASKWGAPDHLVFQRALESLKQHSYDPRHPRLAVVQTSSSHEPFEVPYHNPRFAGNDRQNAFAYTDSCLTAFVDSLRATPSWDNTLIVAVPDHYGCWPQNLKQMPERHAIPLVLAGGTLAEGNRTVGSYGTQADIAATLLGAMNLDHSAFPFSRDLMRNAAPIAVMTEPGSIAVVTPEGYLAWNCDAAETEDSDLPPELREQAVLRAKAWLQTLYRYIDSL